MNQVIYNNRNYMNQIISSNMNQIISSNRNYINFTNYQNFPNENFLYIVYEF